MKIYFLAVSFLSVANAFSTTKSASLSSRTALFAAADQKLKDLVAQQKADAAMPKESPQLFSDALVDDMKEILLILEKRVQDGPGAVDSAEVDRFASMTKNILEEMKEKEYERLEDAKSPAPAAVAPAPEPAAVAAPAPAPAPVAAAPAAVQKEEPKKESMEDGPDYDPNGGQGSLAKGTRNTYIIPGMDEMSSDEYRLALQQTLIDQQAERKKAGSYGNRNTWDYLNNLSGDTGVLKRDPLEE
jgi:hypothetical protein